MASGTVAVRLPDEVLEQLQKRATAENKKVSDLVRELITSGLREQPRTEDAGSAKVIEYLEGFGGVLMGILFEAAGSRYFAEMATKYATDVESLLRDGKPLEKETKATLLKQFEAAARKTGQESWNKVLGLNSAKESG
ncbi:MAG: ribbon-helix-helix protein, CopG family [Candidatus Obscuribacterales bacterium]|nr:ribbon-helix-helix protein, CopG family [Candidatus Obscuribacterales bacterium]